MSGTDKTAPRKRGPRPRPATPARVLTLDDVATAADLKQRREKRLFDQSELRDVPDGVPMAIVWGIRAVDAVAAGDGVTVDHQPAADIIRDDLARIERELALLGVVLPVPQQAQLGSAGADGRGEAA